jgi:hypothetical protein
MEIDEMKAAWADLDRKLEASLRLNRKLMTATALGRVRSALERLSLALALEGLIWLILAVIIGRFIAAHFNEPRFALSAALLDAYAIGNLIAVIRQIVTANRIDHAQPIAAIQRQFEELRVQRIRAVQWSILIGFLAWTPFVVVILKACLDLDAFTILNGYWLLSNLIFSIVVVWIAISVTRRFSPKLSSQPTSQNLMNLLVGSNMQSAARHLAEIAAFEEESASVHDS